MYDLNPFRQAKQILENERLAKQDPREFASEPFDPEDMADLRARRSADEVKDQIHHLNDQHLMHSLAASDPNKSAEERAKHGKHASQYRSLRDNVISAARYGHIKSELRTDPREVPAENQTLLPFDEKRYGDRGIKESEEIEELLDIIDALCEEIGIDSDELFEGYGSMTKKVRRQYKHPSK